MAHTLNQNFWVIFITTIYALLIALSTLFYRGSGIFMPILSFLFIFAYLIPKKRMSFSYSPLILSLTGFTAFATLSYFWSIAPQETYKEIPKLISVSLFAFITINIIQRPLTINSDHVIFLKRLLITSFVFGITILGFECLSDQMLFKVLSGKERVLSSHKNPGAVILSLAIWPVLLTLIKDKKEKLAYILFLVTTVIVFLTDSESAKLSMLIAFFIFILTKTLKNRFVKFCIISMSFLTFIIPVIYSLLPKFWPHILDQFFRGSTISRRFLWRFYANKIDENFLFGHGLNSSRALKLDQNTAENVNFNQALHPHSSLLQIWFETGVIGITLFWAILLCIFNLIYKTNDIHCKAAALACFAGAGAISLVGYGFWQGWLLGTYVLTGFIIALVIKVQASSKI